MYLFTFLVDFNFFIRPFVSIKKIRTKRTIFNIFKANFCESNFKKIFSRFLQLKADFSFSNDFEIGTNLFSSIFD